MHWPANSAIRTRASRYASRKRTEIPEGLVHRHAFCVPWALRPRWPEEGPTTIARPRPGHSRTNVVPGELSLGSIGLRQRKSRGSGDRRATEGAEFAGDTTHGRPPLTGFGHGDECAPWPWMCGGEDRWRGTGEVGPHRAPTVNDASSRSILAAFMPHTRSEFAPGSLSLGRQTENPARSGVSRELDLERDPQARFPPRTRFSGLFLTRGGAS